jgi:hypothetical protein
MITLLHGGQTGVDRGAHEAAIDNGWPVTGYMPRDGRDELGPIPPDVARFLTPHEKPGYGARTEANVRSATALLIVVQDANDPCVTPGTTKTIDLARSRHLPKKIIDPAQDVPLLAIWIRGLLSFGTLPLLRDEAPPSLRLLVAGPRESKWRGAQDATATLLRHVHQALIEIPR